MLTDIVEILSVMVKEARNKCSFEEAAVSIVKEEKYDENLVAAAFSWIVEKVQRDLIINDDPIANSKSLRFFSDDEIAALGKESYEYLLYFYYSGILTEEDLDIIIDQVRVFSNDSNNIEKVKTILLYLFLELDNHSLPGSRHLLFSSDTIN